MKKTFQTTVEIDGIGNSKEQAINKALGKIQQKVMSSYKGLILRIEPKDIRVVEAKETTYTERFLFFFFPRKRTTYKVVMEIDVNVFLLETDQIQFEKTEQPETFKTMILGNQTK
jgi:uncharacterized protein (TIGR03578 family)